LASGTAIGYESIQRFFKPQNVTVGSLAFGVMAISALVNLIMSRLKINYGKKENSVSLISDGIHSRIDVYSSLVILLGLFFIKYWIYADSFFALLMSIYIIKEAFSVGKEAVDCLLDVSADEEIEEKIKTVVKEQNIELFSLKTQKKGSAVTANLEINLPSNLKVEEATKISEDLRKKMMEEIGNLSYLSIQIKSHEIETGFYQPSLGKGFGWQRQGKFKGEIKESKGQGIGGECVCPKCGYKTAHQRGAPCSTLQCPNCKISLERQ
jgi:cation diffusion facilitator family transporter